MMIKNWIKSFLLIPALYSCVLAQDPIQVKYANLMTETEAEKHLAILTSAEFEGRGTGQKGGEKAVQYIANEFEKYGLIKPVNGSYLQPVNLIKTVYKVDNFSINGQEMINGKDLFVQGDNNTADFSTSDIVFIGYGIQDKKHNDLEKTNVKGKVVLLINEGEPLDASGNSLITGSKTLSEWSTNRFKRIQELIKLEPKLILATSSTVEAMLEKMGGRMTSGRFALDTNEQLPTKSTSTPVVNITEKAANQLLSVKKTDIKSLKNSPSTFSVKAKIKARMGVTQEKLYDPNVIGLLEGSDLKNEYIVIGAHYDHDGILPDGTFFPGADDNGSGVVGMLEIAKAFAQAKKESKGPRRSILFIGYAAEEKGLLGSKFYVENPIFPLENTVTCVNIDMIGRIDDKHLLGNHNYLHAIGLDKLSSELQLLTEKANAEYTHMELDYTYNDPNEPMRLYYRSDHYNFAEKGIPSAFFFSGLHPHYHTPEDTIEKINFPMMVKREKLIFHLTWEIANRDTKPVVDSNKK
ncbi:M28 family peptidase [Sphingobacterium sp. UT-1RO-CII-1]|uniref:M28 family peptidase n=1 Tax=Sphingobacterium sp. UT-1RO-CII-1 TaxID=2995225 RepID=UPI00227ACFFD|nr:M28 family peptidase [Sphingobacterium sp. UT-1RO-CII-1]MCY4778126.1 M28 family peptidase [Sphingobacterium sp. UT-1RO-CII-1]